MRDSTIFRVSSLGQCRFEAAPSDKLSYKKFWLCLASRGFWGGTIPELGYWYVRADLLPTGDPTCRTHCRHYQSSPPKQDQMESTFGVADLPNLTDASFASEVAKSVSLEPISWQAPFDNRIGPHDGKSIMLVQGWLLVGGAEVGFLDILRTFARAGYRVTMVLTRLRFPDGLALRPKVAQYTHDIHVLPAFLRMHDFPPYTKYLIDSRGIDTVFMSNSLMIYEILPTLVEMTPRVRWVDYLHNENNDGWKNEGFPSLSLASRRYLDRTIVCSHHLKDFMVRRGYPAERLGVVKLGINVTRFAPVTDVERSFIKKSVLNVTEDTIVIAFSARLDTQKRPWMVPASRLLVVCTTTNRLTHLMQDIMRVLMDRLADEPVVGVRDVQMVMMGEGQSRQATEERIKTTGVAPFVRILGIVDEPEVVMRGSDLFLLPTIVEGLSLAIAEAMALGLPIITSHVGGTPEQLGHIQDNLALGGRLVTLSGNETEESKQFADELYSLIHDAAERRRLGAEAARFVRQSFDQEITLQGMFRERDLARSMSRPAERDTPNPAALFGISNMLLEDRVLADMQVGQRRLSEAGVVSSTAGASNPK